MNTTATIVDGLIDSIVRCLDTESAKRLVALRLDPAIQARVDILAGRANEGTLSDEERTEYQSFIDWADFISILKLEIRRQLNADID